MGQNVKARSASRRYAPAGVAFAVAGLLLFAYFVWRAGPGEIWENISKIGAGFTVIVALAGLRFTVRSYAWTLCFEAPHRLGFADAFRAYLMGDTAGNVVPLGLVVSEPTKVAVVRERVPLGAALAALTLENLFYMLSVALFIFCGAAALLLSFPLPKLLRWSSAGVIIGAAVFLLFAYFAARRQWKFLSGALDWLAARGVGKRALGARREKASALEERVYGFHARNAGRVPVIFLLEATFHLLGVVEAYLTLYLIGGRPPTLLAAFLFESVNRVITMVFKFVPLRVGVDEAGSNALAVVLGLAAAVGVTIAIARKARMLFWMSIGIVLLVRRGLSPRGVVQEESGVWSPESKVKDKAPAPDSRLEASDSRLS